MTLGQIIKEFRSEHNMSMDTFSKKSGISKAYISLLEKNKHPKTGKPIAPSIQSIKQAAEGMGMDFNTLFALLDGNVDLKEDPSPRPRTRIPLLAYVAAGIPIDAIEDILGYEDITEDMAMRGEYFALKVKGDSMAPKIMDGDIVVVRCQPDAENGDIVIVQIDGDTATCKRLRKYAKGIALVSINPAYEPMQYSNEDIENLPVVILGRVEESRRKY